MTNWIELDVAINEISNKLQEIEKERRKTRHD